MKLQANALAKLLIENERLKSHSIGYNNDHLKYKFLSFYVCLNELHQ